MRAWLLSAVLLPCLAYAQSPAAPYPLSKLTVRGNKRFTPAEIAGASGLKIGLLICQLNICRSGFALMSSANLNTAGEVLASPRMAGRPRAAR